MAYTFKAFMEWAGGRTSDRFFKPDGSISKGIIRPPIITEGRKINWVSSTTTLELGAITPISMPKEAMDRIESRDKPRNAINYSYTVEDYLSCAGAKRFI